MADRVGDVAGVGEGIQAVDIVNDSIAVIINAVSGDLPRVGPKVGNQVLVGGEESRVDHRDDDIRGGAQGVPGIHGMDVGPGGASRLPHVPQMPLISVDESRVVGGERGGDVIVRLREGNQPAPSIGIEMGRDITAGRQLQDLKVPQGMEVPVDTRAHPVMKAPDLRGRHPRLRLDEDSVSTVSPGWGRGRSDGRRDLGRCGPWEPGAEK